LPVILPGGQRAKESELRGFLQCTTWVEFRRSLDEEDALHRLVCGILFISRIKRIHGKDFPGPLPGSDRRQEHQPVDWSTAQS